MRTIIQTPSNNLKNSLDFYSKLDFDLISEKDPTIVSDGKVFIEISSDKYARAGIKLFSPNWKTAISQMEKTTPIMKIENGYLLSVPCGMWVYLMEKTDAFDYDVSEDSTSALGNFVGISLESVGIEKSTEIWMRLGFSQSAGATEQGWITLINSDNMAISIMSPNNCPHLFFNPSLTYFNGKKNEQIIKNIKNLDIPIEEEITHFNKNGLVDNIIIRDPGGFGYFIFND
jgi:hypothetical protein